MSLSTFKSFTFFIGLFFLGAINVVSGQNPKSSADSFGYVPANYKLIASGMILKGQKCDFNEQIENKTERIQYKMRIGDDVFYQDVMNLPYEDGLNVQSLKSKTCKRYSMGDLAESNGWFQRGKFNTPMLGFILGLHRIGNKLWMGTNGIGVVVYDLKSKRWARFDVKEKAISGNKTILYNGDNDYLFFMGTHKNVGVPLIIYSVNKNKWVEVKSIPRKAISQFGFTPESHRDSVSLPFDNRIYASKPFMPMHDAARGGGIRITIEDKGKTYIVETSSGDDSKTVFRMSKAEVKEFFN